MSNKNELASKLDSVELVVQDTNKFKIKLGIGEDAFKTLTIKNNLTKIWELKGAAAAGAGIASSTAVASTLFAGTAGPLSILGIGAAAATPVGWVIGAAVLSSGAFYGAKRLVAKYDSSRVETIPKFINTPIDLLGATIFDMMSGLALKISSLSGPIDDQERNSICEYFFEEWGLSADYVANALPIIEASVIDLRLKDMAKSIAEFQKENPDCNPKAMQQDIKTFLEEIAYSDGEYDEVEELALEAVNSILASELSLHKHLINSAGKYSQKTTQLVGNAAGQAIKSSSAALDGASNIIGKLWIKQKK